MLPSGKSAWTLVLYLKKKNAIETKPLHKRGELLETSRSVRDKFSLLPSSRDFSSQQGIPELHFWIAPRFHEIPKEQPNSERSSCWTQQPQPPWADGFHPQQAPVTRKFLCTLDLGGMRGQGGAGPAKWWFLSELGSVCTYYRYSSSLPCFQLGGWSSWWFSCMLKSVAVRGQAVGFIYQLEAPAGNSCISHSAVLGRIPQIYSF